MKTGAELLILVPRICPRVEFIFNWIFLPELLSTFRLTEDRDLFLRYSGPRCQYGGQPVKEGILFWPAVPLLFETGIRMQSPDLSSEKHLFKYGYQQTPELLSDP